MLRRKLLHSKKKYCETRSAYFQSVVQQECFFSPKKIGSQTAAALLLRGSRWSAMGLGSTQAKLSSFGCLSIPKPCLDPLVLDVVTLSQMDLVHNLGVLLGSAPIGRGVVAVAKTAFAHLQIVCQFYTFLDREALLTAPNWTIPTLSTSDCL